MPVWPQRRALEGPARRRHLPSSEPVSAFLAVLLASATLLPQGAPVRPAPVPQHVQAAQSRAFDRVVATLNALPPGALPSGRHLPDADAIGRMRLAATGAQDPVEFRAVITELLRTTGLSHFAVIPHNGAPDPHPGRGWHGMHMEVIGDSAVVTRVEPGSPAAAQGVAAGWRLLSISGDPVAMVTGPHAAARSARERHVRRLALESFMAAHPGVLSEMEFVAPDGARHAVDIQFASPPDEAPCSFRVIGDAEWTALGLPASPRRVGLVTLRAWSPTAGPCIDDAVDALRSADALILDLRGNAGGTALMASGVAGHFLREPATIGTMRAPGADLRIEANPRLVDRSGAPATPFSGALAILVDGGTASTSEMFAAGLEDLGRATIFGGPSAGAALPALVLQLDTGDGLLYAIGDFRTSKGRIVEGIGTVQGTCAPPTLEDHMRCPDAVLRDALEWASAQGARVP